MDSDLSRLCQMPGNHDLSMNEAAEVLQVSECYVQRAVRKGLIEVKRYQARGTSKHGRVRIPRASVVRYLVNISTGDKGVILAAIAAQCPQWLAAAQGVPLPSNVIPMTETRRQARHTAKPEHPGQLFLFSA
jgi:hypothetical protein